MKGRPLILTKKTQEVVVSKERKKAKYTPLSKEKIDQTQFCGWLKIFLNYLMDK